MLLKGSLELGGLRRLGHLRQGGEDLFLREIDVLQGVEKQVFQFFVFRHDALRFEMSALNRPGLNLFLLQRLIAEKSAPVVSAFRIFLRAPCSVGFPTQERSALQLVERTGRWNYRRLSVVRPSMIEIVRRAYELWELAGKPDGKDQEFYHQAERELTETAEAPDKTDQKRAGE
jgi:hypothetical protein